MGTRHTERVGRGIAPVGILFLVALVGCEPELGGSHDSPESLARAVLEALEARDRAAMEALWVTADEHRELLWDQLPESNDLPFDYARSLNERNTRKGIRNAIERFGGWSLELVSIEFTEPPERYDGFTLHFGTRLIVRRANDGEEGELPILDVVLERDGRWKLMNYDEL